MTTMATPISCVSRRHRKKLIWRVELRSSVVLGPSDTAVMTPTSFVVWEIGTSIAITSFREGQYACLRTTMCGGGVCSGNTVFVGGDSGSDQCPGTRSARLREAKCQVQLEGEPRARCICSAALQSAQQPSVMLVVPKKRYTLFLRLRARSCAMTARPKRTFRS
jgi:hypothetical protein